MKIEKPVLGRPPLGPAKIISAMGTPACTFKQLWDNVIDLFFQGNVEQGFRRKHLQVDIFRIRKLA